MAARIGIFLIAIIVLILLGQSVRNRTVLKYDPSTKQVIQVPKSELGNSVKYNFTNLGNRLPLVHTFQLPQTIRLNNRNSNRLKLKPILLVSKSFHIILII